MCSLCKETKSLIVLQTTLRKSSLTWNALYETKCYLPSLHLKRISLIPSLVNKTVRSMITSENYLTAIPYLLVFILNHHLRPQTKRKLLSFFHSVFTHSHFNLPPSDSLSQPPHCVYNACISQLNVLEALQCLTSDKSSGLDHIGPKLLKNCALALYIPIHHLFSLSLASHTIP